MTKVHRTCIATCTNISEASARLIIMYRKLCPSLKRCVDRGTLFMLRCVDRGTVITTHFIFSICWHVLKHLPYHGLFVYSCVLFIGGLLNLHVFYGFKYSFLSNVLRNI